MFAIGHLSTDQKGWLGLNFLTVGGESVSAIYGFDFGKKDMYI
jgi:hypothetical protein